MFLQGLILLCFATSVFGAGVDNEVTPTHPYFQHLGRSKRSIPWETMSETKEEARKKRGWLFGNGSQNGNGCNGVVAIVGLVLGNRKGCDSGLDTLTVIGANGGLTMPAGYGSGPAPYEEPYQGYGPLQGPQGYGPPPPEGYGPPQGPQGYAPLGPPPQGYAFQPPQGYWPPQGPEGYAPLGPQGYAPQPPQGYGYEQPQGQPQGYAQPQYEVRKKKSLDYYEEDYDSYKDEYEYSSEENYDDFYDDEEDFDYQSQYQDDSHHDYHAGGGQGRSLLGGLLGGLIGGGPPPPPAQNVRYTIKEPESVLQSGKISQKVLALAIMKQAAAEQKNKPKKPLPPPPVSLNPKDMPEGMIAMMENGNIVHRLPGKDENGQAQFMLLPKTGGFMKMTAAQIADAFGDVTSKITETITEQTVFTAEGLLPGVGNLVGGLVGGELGKGVDNLVGGLSMLLVGGKQQAPKRTKETVEYVYQS